MKSAVDRLISYEEVPTLDAAAARRFIRTPGAVILFFTGDARLRPEAHDVAVVLREMLAAYAGRFRVGIVEEDAGEELRRRYEVQCLPQLLMFRNGELIDRVARVQRWTVYADKFAALLDWRHRQGRAGGSGVAAAHKAVDHGRRFPS